MAPLRVIVLGLGGVGSAAAATLARRGAEVIGIEQFWPTHDRGSSHGESRAFRMAYYSDPAHVPFAHEARSLWERLECESGRTLFTPCQAVISAPPDSPELVAATSVADEMGIEYEMLTAPEVSRRWPTLTPLPGSLTFLDHTQGVIHPEATVSANLRIATDHGADLRFNTPVNAWRSTQNGVVVDIPSGQISADHLVITPGPWAASILDAPRIPLEVYRYVQVWVRPTADLGAFGVARHPRVTFEGESGTVASGFSLLPGQSLMKIAFIKGSDAATPADTETVERLATPDEAAKVIEFMAQIIPALRGQPAERSIACLTIQTPDDNFVIGPHPDHDNVTLGAAFSVHGFKFIPVVAEILADLAFDGHSKRNIDLFSPKRFAQRTDRDLQTG